MMWITIIVALIIATMFCARVYQLLSPAQRAWLYGRAGAAAGAPKAIGGIVLLIAAVVIAVWGGLFNTGETGWSFASVHKYAWGHGPALLMLAAIAAIAIAVFAGGIKSTLSQVLVWTLVVLFIGCGAADWTNRNIINPTAVTQQKVDVPQQAAGPSRICPNVSGRETASCLITDSGWSNWFQFADGARDNGKQVCASLGLVFQRQDKDGVTFWRLKASSGEMVAQYRLFPADVKCSEVFP